SVFVDVKRMDDRAVLTIRDTGMGMEAGLIRKLFQRFRQGESSSDRKGGLGLGLAISRYLVEQHDGRIEGASAGKGKGSTFTIDLPISTEVPDEFKSRDTNRADDLPDLAGVRVLLVEDQVDNRDMLVTVLRRCGADVKFGASAEEGWETLRDWDPAVIVCDIALPGADGCEFLQNVRLGAMIPALALTVFGSAEEEARVRACGFNTFRQKPIEPADLAHEVARLAAIARTSGSPA
ncbi:MAG TPA: ATP-binding protein, partial [Thermoanaerobaculia bacterium]|nr:ATP-binding protein [Thermoanaerobaculia bacterium]